MSYGPTDDDPLIFVDDDFEPTPSTDSTDDDPLIFVDDDVNPSSDSTDDDPLVFVDDDVNPTSSSFDLSAPTSGNTLSSSLSPPPTTTYLKVSVADSTAIKAKELLSQSPSLHDDDTTVAESNFGVFGVAVVAVGVILFIVVRARHRYYHRQLLNRSRGDGEEVGTDLEDDGSDVSSVWSAADQAML